MKRRNKTLLTFLLAGACAASLCAATINVVSSADEAEGVAVSSVFAPTVADGGKVDVETGETADTVRFTLENGKSVYLKRDLALQWFEDNEEGTVTKKFLNMQFSFKELNFKKVTLTMESASSVVTEEDKAVNTVTFSVGADSKLYVKVNDGAETLVAGEAKEISFALAENATFGSFDVTVNGETVGTFTNIGANFADYALDKTLPLTFTAETDADKSAVILFKELNAQAFNNVKDNLIADTAAPVLVVNEEISSLQRGTAFALNYEKIDVLQDSNLKEDKSFYQYNPASESVAYDSTLYTSTYFLDTTYYTNADGTGAFLKNNDEGTLKSTSVKSQYGEEYVSIKFTLSDKVKTADYYLAWYAQGTKMLQVKDGKDVSYIVINENTDGPQYSYIVADDTDDTNKYTMGDGTIAADQVAAENAYETAVAAYQTQLDDAADKIKASSSSSINLPALDWLIKDNGGYRGLRFTISYRTPSSTSAKTATSLLYNGLKFTTSEEGVYEFKVFANDAAGNPMYYYKDGERVAVSSGNVWDIEEIKSFKFTVADNPISVKKPTKDTDKRVEKLLDQTYTLSGITVEGATSEKNAFALYRFDDSKYDGTITEANLLKVSYDEIIETAKASYGEVGGEKYPTYFDLYVHAYSKALAGIVKGSAANDTEIKAIADCFTRIDEYNAEITESNDKEAWEAYNKYSWNPTAKSFKTVEEGNFFIFGDYYEDYLPSQRAAAYKLVIVESKADVIKGESQFSAWVKNNVVSVILFGVAGLMLIAIIVLLLVHPSDETLEDVDEAAKRKSKKDE